MPHDELKMTRETPQNKALQLIDKRFRIWDFPPVSGRDLLRLASFSSEHNTCG